MTDAHTLWAAAQLVPGEGIEDGVARIEALQAEDIHSCGPTCTRAGCVAARLREERDQLRKDVAALNKIIDTRLIDAARKAAP